MADKSDDKHGDASRSDDLDPPDSGAQETASQHRRPREIGGRDGPDPTRYGDWEKAGRCVDF